MTETPNMSPLCSDEVYALYLTKTWGGSAAILSMSFDTTHIDALLSFAHEFSPVVVLSLTDEVRKDFKYVISVNDPNAVEQLRWLLCSVARLEQGWMMVGQRIISPDVSQLPKAQMENLADQAFNRRI